MDSFFNTFILLTHVHYLNILNLKSEHMLKEYNRNT